MTRAQLDLLLAYINAKVRMHATRDPRRIDALATECVRIVAKLEESTPT